MGVGQGFGPKPQPPRNPHSRSGTPQIRDRLLLQFPSSGWGQGLHLYCVCVCVYIHICAECVMHTHTYIYIHTHTYISCLTPWVITPIKRACAPKTSAWNWNESSGGRALILMPTRFSIPDPNTTCFMCSPLLGMVSQALCCPSLAIHLSF